MANEQVPINITGSSLFGIYPKISLEKTYNMFISDDWMVNYAGYKEISDASYSGKGRAIFKSVRGDFLVAVIGSGLYKITHALAPQFIANIQTSTGFVSIDENLSEQICIADGSKAYIYHYPTETLTVQALSFTPNYVCYHNTFFLIGSSPNSTNPQKWYAYQYASPTTISLNTEFALQTKPDVAWAVKRLPGKGNNIVVFGKTVVELWTNTGGAANYTRMSSFNIDNGCISVATIAASEDFIVWLSQNENNSPSIMMTNGAQATKLSTDGIDNMLQDLRHPEQSTAFFYRQDGHLFYQITFYNSSDNVSLIYDFNTQKFFHVSDEDLNYHPARNVVYFDNKTLFVSLNDNGLYDMSTNYYSYTYQRESSGRLITEDEESYIITETGEYIIDEEGNVIERYVSYEIPRIRICKSIRFRNSEVFAANSFRFWIEQGVNDFLYADSVNGQGVPDSVTDTPCVDMSFSKNGNQSFSNVVRHNLNTQGNYKNQITWYRMGFANEFTIQLRFWGFNRVCVADGVLEVVK